MNQAWQRDAPPSAKVIQVLEKAPKEYLGVFKIDKDGHNWVIDPQNKFKVRLI